MPKDKVKQISGMNSFSGNMVTVLSPVLAAAFFAWGGLPLVLLIDLASFGFAFLVLLFVLKIPEKAEKQAKSGSAFAGSREGIAYLRGNRLILRIMLTMAVLNFLSRLTYENILSPMILARSGGDSEALGIVNAAMGIGGIVGGILVSSGKIRADSIKMIYVSAAISFCFGDLLMGAGRNTVSWSVAAVAANLPIAFVNAGQMDILYRNVPDEIQGRIFAVRNMLQFSTIPAGILLGGFLADYVFEPFMVTDAVLAERLRCIVGNGAGSGMAVMFLCTGVLGSVGTFLLSRGVSRCQEKG